jgi:pimeloyl-ACP methyl ester carboxylesterase
MASQNKTQELFFEERNPVGDVTIVFLHSAGSCRLEWHAVADVAALAPYHLLLIDLPRHSGSREVKPLTLQVAADGVANVIAKHAHRGMAHIVGMSLGAFAALYLTMQHPNIILSCFASGAFPYEGIFRWFSEWPSLMWWMGKVQNAIPGFNKLLEKAQGLKINQDLKQ